MSDLALRCRRRQLLDFAEGTAEGTNFPKKYWRERTFPAGTRPPLVGVMARLYVRDERVWDSGSAGVETQSRPSHARACQRQAETVGSADCGLVGELDDEPLVQPSASALERVGHPRSCGLLKTNDHLMGVSVFALLFGWPNAGVIVVVVPF